MYVWYPYILLVGNNKITEIYIRVDESYIFIYEITLFLFKNNFYYFTCFMSTNNSFKWHTILLSINKPISKTITRAYRTYILPKFLHWKNRVSTRFFPETHHSQTTVMNLREYGLHFDQHVFYLQLCCIDSVST